MNIEYRKLSTIHLNPENPRLIKDEAFKKLCKSIQEFPRMLELRPIVVDDLGEILAGNQRYRACKELGIKEAPVLLASDLTDEQKQEFIVRDNAHYGEWDFNILSTHFDSDILEDWGLDVFPKDITPIDLTSGQKENQILEDNYKQQYGVVIECISESTQQEVYNKAVELGWKARVVCV